MEGDAELAQWKIWAGIVPQQQTPWQAGAGERPGGPLMSDRVPPQREKVTEHGDPKVDQFLAANEDKIVKTLIGTAKAMDKQDRPGVDNPSKSNLSVYINYQLEQIIDHLVNEGYDIQWTEQGWED